MKMSFLKRYFMNALQPVVEESTGGSSFASVSDEALEDHLRISKYGDFRLTDAVRPSYDLEVTPVQGYRYDTYRDESSGATIPVLMAAASRDILFDLFMDAIESLGSEVDVVLETSHLHERGRHRDLYREHIDMPVLNSTLWDYEDLLLNDGCTGIAVINPNTPQEVQFDEHKLLIIYGQPQELFEDTLRAHGVRCQEDLRFITEAEHVHSSKDDYLRQFEELSTRLGMDGYDL